MKKIIVSTALLMGLAQIADAAPITSLSVEDVGSGLPGEYSSTLDGFSGAFQFASIINDTTYFGASLFSGDLGEIDVSQANATNTFSSGFDFAGSQFVPSTLGPIVADISIIDGAPILTVDSLPFAGVYFTTPAGTLFDLGSQTSLSSDCSVLASAWAPLVVDWVNQIDATHYNYKISWSHCITKEQSDAFKGLVANWKLEGIATVSAVPVPAAAWLFGSGLLGLIGVARRKMC